MVDRTHNRSSDCHFATNLRVALGRFLVMLKAFWLWFYDEIPAYYSIPIIALVAAIILKGVF